MTVSLSHTRVPTHGEEEVREGDLLQCCFLEDKTGKMLQRVRISKIRKEEQSFLNEYFFPLNLTNFAKGRTEERRESSYLNYPILLLTMSGPENPTLAFLSYIEFVNSSCEMCSVGYSEVDSCKYQVLQVLLHLQTIYRLSRMTGQTQTSQKCQFLECLVTREERGTRRLTDQTLYYTIIGYQADRPTMP